MLDNLHYWDFCMRHVGRYIHHVPHLPEEKSSKPKVLYATIQAMRATGFEVDAEL